MQDKMYEDLHSILVDAYENGYISYWGILTRIKNLATNEYQDIFYVSALGSGNSKMILPIFGIGDLWIARKRIIDGEVQIRDDIRKSIILEDYDAEAIDCIIQTTVYGEIVFS